MWLLALAPDMPLLMVNNFEEEEVKSPNVIVSVPFMVVFPSEPHQQHC